MGYHVKEIYCTLQGEGAQTGRPAVLCRFTGCNLWSGREEDRALALCRFCDTDFVGTDGAGGGRYPSANQLAEAVASAWAGGRADRYVVFTGGEPTLQLDEELLEAVHALGFSTAVETNGTRLLPAGLDWVCVSPKANCALLQREGNELKLVYPQPGLDPEALAGLTFEHFFLQPMDGPDLAANVRAAVEYCLLHPKWRLSVQSHKLLGIP